LTARDGDRPAQARLGFVAVRAGTRVRARRIEQQCTLEPMQFSFVATLVARFHDRDRLLEHAPAGLDVARAPQAIGKQR
jgi:hypothetical protein